MHELAVTQSILEIALRHAEHATRITDIYLVVGQLSSMVDDCVQFYWDTISQNTIAQGAMLHFKRVPAQLRCQDCAAQVALGDSAYFGCPNCHSQHVELLGGNEFYVEAIDIL